MATSDALYIVEDWISEHYFVSDDKSGTFAARAKELLDAWRKESAEEPEYTSPRERFTAHNSALISRLVDLQAEEAALPASASGRDRRQLLGERSEQLSDLLRWTLGYTGETGAAEQWDVVRHGPLRMFATRGVDETPFVMLDAIAAGDVESVLSKQAGHLPADVVLDEGTDAERTLTSVPQVLSALALEPTPPEFMLVLAGRYAVLTSSDLWPQGRYLVADIQTIAERNDLKRGGEVERMLASLSADSLAPDPSSQIWWTTTREQAVANAVGVSEDLRDGVRESIEIIANEVLRRRRRSHGLGELPEGEAQELAIQSLRYLYRILFLLYAEASPELGVLPTGAPEFDQGYSVGRLRQLVEQDVPLEAVDGTYFYDSLENLFHLVNNGNGAATPTEEAVADADTPAEHGDGTLRFENLEADLFEPDGTEYINDVGLGNAALKEVLERLLLSKEKKGKARGAISYVALGINQLGAVYESLMSYTGSIATEELVEVAKNGNTDGGSWVVPADTLDESLLAHRVMVPGEDGEPVPRTYRHGEFVFRLSGRERQQSASYYSPEVITKFTVSQGLAELLDPVIEDETDLPEGAEIFSDEDFDHQPIRRRRTTAEEILGMSICEPALGSGAFAIEAVRQLAEEYLTRRQKELDKRIDPEAYATELQRVKAYIALHNVYGVDLNATAVELAEVSLWLDTMAPGLKAPWFGLRLRAGNSLIGARHATYTSASLARAKLKDIVATAPAPLPVSTVHEEFTSTSSRKPLYGKIFHFLLPAEGWLAAARDAEVKKLAPDEAKALSEHAKLFQGRLTDAERERLRLLTQRVEELWGFALRRLELAEENTRRAITVWGMDTVEGGEVTRAEIEQSLRDENSSYRRLRLVMDAWCALWFWPVLPEDHVKPPTFTQWLDTLERILGKTLEVVADERGSTLHRAGQMIMGSAGSWNELDVIESMFSVNGASSIESLVAETPWLERCIAIAKEQKFFHWELDFVAAFNRGGFDLQVGNPPWRQPLESIEQSLAEVDPRWVLEEKIPPAERVDRIQSQTTVDEVRRLVLRSRTTVHAVASFLGAGSNFSESAGSVSDLYRSFMVVAWRHSESGVIALLHPPSVFTGASGASLRAIAYPKLRRHWKFVNARKPKLFRDVGHTVQFSVSVYGKLGTIDFLVMDGVIDPSTVSASLRHDGAGPRPSSYDEGGARSLTPHRQLIKRIRSADVSEWGRLRGGVESGDALLHSRMPSVVSGVGVELIRSSAHLRRFGQVMDLASEGWNETTDLREGRISRTWGHRDWNSTILQGPNFQINNPLAQDRNPTLGSYHDYSAIDLSAAAEDLKIATEYAPSFPETPHPRSAGPRGGNDKRHDYRFVWRRRVDPVGERTFISALFPPGTSHIHQVRSAGSAGGLEDLVLMAATASSLVFDAIVRTMTSGDVQIEDLAQLPLVDKGGNLSSEIMIRVLRLNCLTSAFSALWEECWREEFSCLSWAVDEEGGIGGPLGVPGPEWTTGTPLRSALARRRAQVELDVLVALEMGVSADRLIDVYRVEFGKLGKADRVQNKKSYLYDLRGRIVPTSVRAAWNKAGRPETGLPLEDRTAVHPSATGTGRTIVYEQPFRILDREADMRQAYAEFTRRMEENGS